ncbi:MAG: bifunctional phosphoribosyl-AMP cyclohydrolase/phosphoribosyl-ATP diphosphatase HisIE [Lachnospiraceae bacterium]|nr:bifunctional phosphoribosyl-AMP cyclohydrolase/phosphoribosyl-ATP diphosphatase HisIE [Lachnospiraceae bacterium]
MKLLIPTIYLKKGQAVTCLQKQQEVLSTDPVSLAAKYRDEDADALMIFDLSCGDEEHEINLDVMKAICEIAEVPVYGAGNVKRMEDIKKILYTGCKKAVLNYSKAEGIAITEEVSKKFGADKLLASVSELSQLRDNRELLEQYVSGVICMNEIQTKEIKLPLYAHVSSQPENKSYDMISGDVVDGLMGNAVLDIESLRTFKEKLDQAGKETTFVKSAFAWSDFKLNSDGMVPVVVQDYKTDAVLMVAYMNEEAYQKTLQTGKMTYYSRSRQELWLKGDTSGHFQYVKSLTADCDMDTILARVSQVGAACHTGRYSCFYQNIMEKEYEEKNPMKILQSVYDVIEDRKLHPKEGSYTNYLFDKGIDKILKKVGEEATEIVIAAKNPNKNEVKYEISDFLYHMMVLMAEKGVSWEEITDDLAKR